jgi:beta-glucosidase
MRTRHGLILGTLAGAMALACAPRPAVRSGEVPPTTVLPFPYRNPDLALDVRVRDLLDRMTLEEKVSQLQYTSAAIPRLGVPAYNWWNEALHGVARAGRATVFPQAIGLAATWDTDLLLRVASTIGDEARAKHHEAVREGRRGIYEGLTFWSPNINIFRDPRWGRGMETYGEDPYLTGRLAVAFVRGMQGDDPRYLKTISTPKHFAVHSGPEPERHSFNAVVSERDLRETYLPHFEAAVVEGGARSVMCAYNRVLGDPACASRMLLQDVLRDRWGFTGYVVSDCWAISDIHQGHKVAPDEVHAAAMALNAGTDLSCGPEYASLTKAVAQGLVREAQIDTALARLLRARFRLGMFDPPNRLPFPAAQASAPPAAQVIDAPSHRALALEAARKSLVLLKNEGHVLPLPKGLGTIAVIGPNADDVDLLFGNYNGLATDPVTPLAGIRAAAGLTTRVLYARGADVAPGMPSLEVVPASALQIEGRYFATHDFTGDPVETRVDSALDFTWWEAAPAPGVPKDSFSVRWTGEIVPPVTGTYALGVRAMGGARLFLDDSLLVEFSDRHVVATRWATVPLTAEATHNLRVEYFDRRADAIVQLVWSKPDPRLREEALDAARQADAVIMMLGLSPRLEGEEMRVDVPGFKGGDRVTLDLPSTQEDLLRAVVAVGKPVVLVLLNGSAVAVNWAADHVPAILEAWYPGQAAGTAIADVLFGDYNPAGRLPVTFYKSVDQLPPFEDYDMAGHTYRYFTGEPLFPFGHGLSYTTFAYHDLRLPPEVRAGDSVSVSVEVENTGLVVGEEVVQLYLTDTGASVPVPIRSLVGFRRVSLKPGERRRVEFTITPRQQSLIDDSGTRVIEPGKFRISVGGKQPGFSGVADASTTGVVTGEFEVHGGVTAVRRSGG